MQIHVISVKGSSTRRATIGQHLNDIGFGFPFFDVVNGGSEAVVAHYVSKPDFFERSYTYSEHPIDQRELACTLSHMVAIRQAWQAGCAGHPLILEDDALFCSTDRALLEDLMGHVPEDAPYVQFGLTPTGTIVRLSEHFRQGGGLHVAKNSSNTIALEGSILGCHSTASYLMTAIGMRVISERWYDGELVVFPCDASEIDHNVALVAGRLVYQTAISQGGFGYVCAVPVVTTTALECTRYPDHVPWQQEARNAALEWFEALRLVFQ